MGSRRRWEASPSVTTVCRYRPSVYQTSKASQAEYFLAQVHARCMLQR